MFLPPVSEDPPVSLFPSPLSGDIDRADRESITLDCEQGVELGKRRGWESQASYASSMDIVGANLANLFGLDLHV